MGARARGGSKGKSSAALRVVPVYFPDPDPPPRLNLQPMSDLDLMIANGWGDVSQEKLPADWRTRRRDGR